MSPSLKILMFMCLLFCLKGYGQLMSVHKIINYEPKDYFAHNQNWQTVQAKNGVLFFANGDGVLEYDGTNWTLHKTQTRTNVLSVAIDEQGTVYYGGVGEVGFLQISENGRYEAKEIQVNGDRALFDAEFFWDIHIHQGKVIFKSDNSMVVFEKGNSTFLDLSQENYRTSFIVGDKIWVQSKDNQVYSASIANLQSKEDFDKEVRLVDKTDFVFQNMIDFSDDQYLVITNVKGLFLLDKQTFSLTEFSTPLNDIEKISIDNALILPNREIVVSTTNLGVYILSRYGRINMHYTDLNGLKTNAIRGVFYDREGLLWFNTDVGLSKALYNKPFSWLPEGFSKIKGNANAVIESNGDLYVASNEGVYRIGMDNSFIETESLSNLSLQAFDVCEVGQEIFAATTSGLFQLVDDKFKMIVDDYSRSLLSLSDSYLVVGGRKNFLLLQKVNGKWTLQNTVPILDEFLHLEQDPSQLNIVWGGLYSSGVARMEIDTLNHSVVSEVYNPKFDGVEGYILPFALDDRMVFAPKSSGLYQMDKNKKELLLDEQLTNFLGNDISCWLVKEDIYGNQYIEDSGPVYILKKNDAETVLDSTSLTDLNIGYINDIFCSETGVVWLIGEEGIVKYDPMEAKQNQTDFVTLVNGVYVNVDSVVYEGSNFESLRKDKKCILDDGYNNISFAFASPQYAFEGSLFYSYKLKGYDGAFSDWTLDTKAVYTNLNEGKYVFMVKSLNSDGIESSIGEFEFEVLPPWYRTWWAYLCYVLIFLLVIILVVRIYSARLKRSNIKLQQSVDEKTRVISQNLAELAIQKGQLEERNNEMIGSIEYAKRLQSAILPSQKSLQVELGNSFVYYNPKDIVAGDFYWMNKLKLEDKVLVAVADCTGHGVPGALVSVVCSDALKTAVNEFKLTKPSEILDAVNRMVLETFNEDAYGNEDGYLVRDGMDVALCQLDLKNRKLLFTGANNPFWIVTKREISLDKFYTQDGYNIYELKGDRKPIGGYASQEKFNLTSLDLAKDDACYMFTDGIVDQFGSWDQTGKNKKFKRINLAKLLVSIQSLTLVEQENKISEVFNKWKGPNEQIDDVTLMGIKID